ncbi:Signal transduction histidine kinase CheA [hydrothermal vent metagenome]|uniref:histidine kinase n=1 Tax=hydrothermal vent metagenome TaxID=652676 RepID=A0A3B1ATA6_9ZZZZ
MSSDNELDLNTLIWVKSEIDETLNQARKALEIFTEDESDVSQIQFCLNYLHQVRGTLQMVELYGSAMAAEEVENLVQALIDNKVSNRNDAYEVLIRGILQLPDYLEHLLEGNADTPMLLLPLLNDLRAARGAPLLSENALFTPDLTIAAPLPESISGNFSDTLRRLRYHYHLGLLSWFRDKDDHSGLQRIAEVLDELRKCASEQEISRLLWVADGLVESLVDAGLDGSISVKLLLGQLDRQFKKILDRGEHALNVEPPSELLKNILYYVATSRSRGELTDEVKLAFKLDDILPDMNSLEQARADMAAPNAALMTTVSSVLMDDLLKVKDNLDLFVRADVRDISKLQPLKETLAQMADTLGMLGLGIQRESVQAQIETISIMQTDKSAVNDDRLMDMAGAMLDLENSLNEINAARTENIRTEKGDGDVSSHLMQDAEQLKLLKMVVKEAKLELDQVKDAINMFSKNPSDHSLLEIVPSALDRIKGGISILSLDRAANLLQGCIVYIRENLLKTTYIPEADILDSLADAISSIEYYLESLAGKWGQPDAILDVAEYSLKQLQGEDTSEENDELVTLSGIQQPDSDEQDTEKATASQIEQSDDTLIDLSVIENDEIDLNDQTITETIDISLEDYEEESLHDLSLADLPQPDFNKVEDELAEDELNDESLHTLTLDLEGFDNEIDAVVIDEDNAEISSVKIESVFPETEEVQEREPANVDETDEITVAELELENEQEETQPGQTATAAQAPTVMEEIDEEIIEIFLEEAEEVYEQISKQLPKLLQNPDDEDTLAELRRAFHTLKGSGRLVGAIDIGEFAWAYENMLNRIMDKTIPASDCLCNLLEQARQVLPSMYEMFKQGTKPGADISTLIEHANLISQGKPLPDASEIENSVEPAVVGDIETAETIDPVLLDIYRKEVEAHLESLQSYINGWENGRHREPNQDLIRALHTLTGSSRTTNVVPIAELCSLFEHYASELLQLNAQMNADAIELLSDSIDYIRIVTNRLDQEMPEEDGNQLLVSQLQILFENIASAPRIAEMREQELAIANDSDEFAGEPEYDEDLLDIFIEEGEEILDASDSTLHHWQLNPDDQNDIEAMQRYLHTLKGGARMAGVKPIGDLSHNIESMLTFVAEERQQVSDNMFTTLQRAQDRLVQMLEQLKARQNIPEAQDIIAEVTALINDKVSVVAAVELDEVEIELSVDDNTIQTDILSKEEINVEGEAPGIEHSEDSSGIGIVTEDINVSSENEAVIDTPEASEDAHASEDVDAVKKGEVSEEADTFEETDTGEEGDISEEVDAYEEADIGEEAGLSDEINTTETYRADNVVALVTETVVEATKPALVTGDEEKKKEPPRQARQKVAEQIRVKADLLDDLVNFAGEVSIYRSRMEQQSNSFGTNLQELDDTVARLREQLHQFEIETETQIQYRREDAATKNLEDFDPLEFDRFTQMQHLSRAMLESLSDLDSLRGILSNINRESETLLLQQSRVNTELQEGLMRTRLVPFTGHAPRLRRIVRQTSDELGKKVKLELEGLDNELDRTVMDKIIPSLEHMLRNAVAHGIELPEVRLEHSKPEAGMVKLSFNREGSDIIISITDDGAGLDYVAIKNKAIENGLLSPDANINKDIVQTLIMESGFSTVEEVSQISGRGVGMDVVNTAIKQMGGLVDIESESGQGTRFIISLPLTLAISRALMVNVADETFALPLLSVQGVERMSVLETKALMKEEKPVYEWLGEEFRFMNLGHLMGMQYDIVADDEQMLPLLMVRSGDYRAAVLVDGLLGTREVVVKPVGPQLSSLRGVSGATIMGDGSVILVLDLGLLIHRTITKEMMETAQPKVKEVKRLMVMVVDDSITVRKVTSRLLERNNYNVILAKDGVDALGQLMEARPDVILLDIEMPHMDGFELATNIRNDQELKEIPIIMITSRTGDKHRRRAFSIGVNGYMGKPFSEDELLENIRELTEK